MRLAPALLFVAACSDGRLSLKNQPDTPVAQDADAAPAPATPSSEAPLSATEAEVAVQVAHNNAAEPRDIAPLEADGWQRVDGVPMPEPELLAFAPAFARSNPEAMRTQLLSTTPQRDAIASVEAIAAANVGELRLAAINALGRAHAVASLLRLMDGLDEEARLYATPLMLPEDLDDATVPGIVALLDSAELGQVEKEQLAFNLAAISLRDGTELSPSHPLVDTMKARIAQ